jgi:hypothetical protein
MNNEIEELLSIIKLSEQFNKLLLEKKSRLPYQLNLIDELRANENAHSRILLQLLSYNENGNYPFLESLFKYLDYDFTKIVVKKPHLTAEKERIDALIMDKDYAVIIENKIHGAVDQEEQIKRYVEKLERHNYKREQLFVLYLSREGGEPSIDSLPDFLRNELDARYRAISFRYTILPWLEENVLPSCRLKDTLLISAIQQYIDHLNGLFGKRKIEKKMNEELNKYLAENLNFEKNKNLTNLLLLEEKKKNIGKLLSYFSELHKDVLGNLFEEWKNRLELKYPNYEIVTNAFGEKQKNDYWYLGIKLKYNNVDFSCAIGGMDNGFTDPYVGVSKLYYGLTIRGCGQSKNSTIGDMIKTKVIDSKSYSTRWYYYNYSETENIYNEFETFCDDVINKLKG